MKEKYAMFKFVFASLVCCLMAAAMITGCGGSNNPAGPTGSASAAISNTFPANATGTVTLNGLLVDMTTQNLISEAAAKIYVTIRYVSQSGYEKTIEAVGNNAFSFESLPAGLYSISVEDKGGFYENSNPLVQELTSGKITLTIPLTPKVGVIVPSSLNFFAKVLDASLRNPIMFATVDVTIDNVSNLTFQATSLFDGQFSIMGIASGTYKLKFSKDGFVTAEKTLTITDRIMFGAQEINVNNLSAFKDGSGANKQGYDLGEIVLAPKFTVTGGLSGILLDAAKNPIAGPLDLVYIANPVGTIPPSTIIPNVMPNALGYVSFKNLPAGYYLLSQPGYTPVAIVDVDGNTVGWDFSDVPSKLVTRIWLLVTPGLNTPIPEQE